MRANETDAEKRLWRDLRQLKKQGFHFRRQAPIDHYIVDFVCFSQRLVIEVDGGQHAWEEGQIRDRRRNGYLKGQGFQVLRFWNNDVLTNRDGVMEVILATLDGAQE